MDKIKVAIYDEDVDYSRRLMNYLNRNYGKQMNVVAFTQKEHLIRETKEYGFDYVVTPDVEQLGAVKVIRITEEEEEEGYYRYGSAKELAGRIIEECKKREAHENAQGKIIGIYSLTDMNRRTEFAFEKAKMLHGIYIGMEEFCSIESEEYRMEELLFLIRNRTETICSKLEEYVQLKDGIRYLPSARCFLDYRFLNYEDYNWFVQKLSGEREDTFIFDIGIGNYSDLRFFSVFDVVYFLTSSLEKTRKKEHAFLNLLSQEVPDIHDKIIFKKDVVE